MAHGIKQGQLAKAAGITSQSAVSNIFKGTRRLRVEEKAAWERMLGLSEHPDVHWLPAIDLEGAEDWPTAVENPKKSLPVTTAGPRAFAVLVEADDARQVLPDGGWAAIDPDQTSVFVGKLYLASRPNQAPMICRYQSDPARLVPTSTGGNDQPWEVGAVPFQIVGRVIAYGCES